MTWWPQAGRGTTEHWVAALLEHDVWCGRVQTHEQLESDPQRAHNGLLWGVEVGADGELFRPVGSPLTLSRTSPRVRRGVPRAEQHTAEVLADEQ